MVTWLPGVGGGVGVGVGGGVAAGVGIGVSVAAGGVGGGGGVSACVVSSAAPNGEAQARILSPPCAVDVSAGSIVSVQT
ncbi:hypothetical protein B7R54_13040 [Subtercola boreus]|uniref:Uncharacterized protein n=1 Tax=Subtercola boreus TaxID=120213 RepID=A0A3E0VMA9_9MICO|nr:hypothetical protein B7R54_13040 [Subtercola boreus]